MDEYKNTIDYYDANAKDFVNATLDVEFKNMQEKFLRKLPIHADILDFGCGSGRDTKYFLEQEYSVDAVDGSKELCKLASEYTGKGHLVFVVPDSMLKKWQRNFVKEV